MTVGKLAVLLRAREEELSAIYQNVPGILFYIAVEPDGEFRFLSVSRDFLLVTGLTQEQIVGSRVRDVIPEPSRDMVLNHYREAIRSGQPVRWEEESVYPAGRRYGEVAVTPLFDTDGVATHLVGIVHDITERKRLEESLRESEERLRLAMNSGNIGFRDWDVVSGRTTWSQELENIFGLDHAGSYEAFRSLVHPDDLAVVESERDAAIRNHKPFDLEFRIILPSGEIRWLSARGRGFYDEIGRVVRVVESNIDITERIQAKEALREREQRLRLALNASGGGTWTWDARTNRVDWDDRFRELYGFTTEEAPSPDAWTSRVHEEDRQRVVSVLNQILYTKTKDSWNNVFRVIRPDGTMRWIESLGQVHRDAEGQIVRLIGLDLDVTERRRTEEALQVRRDEDRDRTLQLLLETAPQGILSMDARGVIVTANRALEQMFGCEPGELAGQSVEQLLPSALRDRHVAHRAAYFATPRPRFMGGGLDLVGQRKDGSAFPIEISLNHVTTADGGQAIAFVTDISARKRDEDALQRSHAELERRTLQLSRLASQLTLAEQNAREQLARTLHDGLQQLLFSAGITLEHAVKANSESDQVGLLQRARADVREAVEAARTLSLNLFPPMLHLGGLPVALAWLAKRTQEQYGVIVSVTADPQANPVASDARVLLFEAVRELLFNAVKHARVDRVDVNLALGPDDTIHIQVSDQGVGFDPAVTLHHNNQQQIGLGLFSIQERLALLGGHLDIKSALGKGARFSLTLPRTDLLRQASGAVEIRRQDAGWQERLVYDSANGTSKSLRILIADDHAVARAGLRELFSRRPPLQVVGEAANGLEAISQAIALEPDVVVMDVSMPQMNGIEATREIHSTHPHIRIVGLSTHDDENMERLMRGAGAEGYFTKNEGTDRLLNYLLSLLAQAKAASIN